MQGIMVEQMKESDYDAVGGVDRMRPRGHRMKPDSHNVKKSRRDHAGTAFCKCGSGLRYVKCCGRR